jgi:hypothetical protein
MTMPSPSPSPSRVRSQLTIRGVARADRRAISVREVAPNTTRLQSGPLGRSPSKRSV